MCTEILHNLHKSCAEIDTVIYHSFYFFLSLHFISSLCHLFSETSRENPEDKAFFNTRWH